jgi:hypothetical protein
MEDLRSFSNFDSMCKSPNVKYLLLESKMKNVTNRNVVMVNLASHTNLLSKGRNSVGGMLPNSLMDSKVSLN